MAGNEILRARMAEAGFTQVELADAVNADLFAVGYEGTVSDRTVRNWLTGKTRWPHRRQRAALEAVFNCPITELGFIPREKPSRKSPEATVLRRHFITASAATLAATAAPAHAAQRRVGMSDVTRLHDKFAVLVATDFRYGGRRAVETQATALAEEALTLQRLGTASQRVRSALYSCAASFTSSALWAAIDGRRFGAAQSHFDRASSLAAMSGDSTIQFRIWSHASSLYRHMDRPADACAASDVARALPIARRDPMFASLGHARHAAIHGHTGDLRAVRQTIGYAEEAHERASAGEERPVWMAGVCDRSEIEGLALSAHFSLGNYETAEAHAHRSLSLLRPGMQRDRALVTARLAHAQLGQGDVEQAVDTAMRIPADVGQHPRVNSILEDFTHALHLAAPSSHSRQAWDEYNRDGRRNAQ
ncbi:helix-turn-helix transcriptional regulator [Streptomyces sp. XM4011]|uniref:helix-turn-helix transcriptional regulator n=1 Tax=Streptomyces sp. XM4011 TaxID=2929780 RepID=UPI001FF93CD0|nr:helix-turn-helix transcriptional regulator [Streptomyces sp. XM4011]MCK1813224.1 helix-turn-helix transcriptional regulator [Streptomyces sp. XM4011]